MLIKKFLNISSECHHWVPSFIRCRHYFYYYIHSKNVFIVQIIICAVCRFLKIKLFFKKKKKGIR